MDPKSIQIFARQKLGFFFTPHPEGTSIAAKEEHGIVAELIKLIADGLKEQKIRAINVHDNWQAIADLADKVDQELYRLKAMVPEKVPVFENLTSGEASQAWSLTLVMACIGQYNFLVERRKKKSD